MTALGISPEDAGSDAYGKPVSELQDNIIINGTKISGTLHHVTGYTKFSSDTSEQSGNFLAMKVNASEDATVKFKIIGGKSPEKTLDPSDHQIVFKISSTSQKLHFSVTKGEQTKSVEYDLNGLTLESGGDV